MLFPAVAREGYRFDGWFTEKDGGTSIEEGFRISSNMRLYAHWHEATFAKLCFDACGGTCSEDERQIDVEDALSALPIPERSGYWFIGWYTDEDAGTVVAQGDVISSDMVLYAHWLKLPSLNSLYLVVNLSEDEGTPQYQVSELDECPDDGWSDEYKTKSLVLRLIEGGITNQNGRAATVTNSFYVGVFEVTQRQWELVMGMRPSYFSNDEYYASRPVEQISKADAEAFINVLQERTGLNISLPTESQWEYACRAGTTTLFNDGTDKMSSVGRYWYNGGRGGSGNPNVGTSAGTAAVGSYLPNEWGLYDMHGNVSEWCQNSVSRGGSWHWGVSYCTSSYRLTGKWSDSPGDANFKGGYGFRVFVNP